MILTMKTWRIAVAVPPILAIALALAPPKAFSGAAGDDGERTFSSKCSICHGADGSANTAFGKKQKLRDLHSADVQKQTDAQLAEIIAKGKGKMQAYEGKLTTDEIKRLVAYVRELAKKK